jgi:dinuclear metal center YbgI/SA1388 family protein
VPALRQVVEVLDELYDPTWAAEWDAVGLVCGDPDAEVARVLFAVDPVLEVADEALAWPADLIVAHHPLFLRGVHGVAATTPKGVVVHRLLTRGVALHVCHTNADAADPGVSDALARVLDLTDLRPLDPRDDSGKLGVGRVGRLPEPEPLDAFRARVAAALPPTAHGVRAAGDPTRQIATVAVCGGAGDSYLDLVRRVGVDAYVTADLRHHPASEAGQHADAPALVDVSHWASEWPWLSDAAARLVRALERRGTTVETRVSTTCTDPWAVHTPSLVRGDHEGTSPER